VDFFPPVWFKIAPAMKTYTLFASIAVFGLLGLFASGCSDSSLSCTEFDAGPPDGAGPDLAVGSDVPATVPDAPLPADAADGPASGGDGGLELDGGAGDDGGLDLGGGAVADGGGDGGLD
jgi:hypothetical protein